MKKLNYIIGKLFNKIIKYAFILILYISHTLL
jgi:hypothetical protein